MSLLLQHTPGEWDGTFVNTAAAMCLDLLLDGPIEITVDGSQSRLLTRYDTGTGTLYFADGSEVSVFEITKLEVA